MSEEKNGVPWWVSLAVFFHLLILGDIALRLAEIRDKLNGPHNIKVKLDKEESIGK